MFSTVVCSSEIDWYAFPNLKMGHLHFHLTYFPNVFKVSKYRWRYCLTFFPKLATSIVRIMNFLRGFTNSAFSMFLLKTAIYLYETSEQLI